MAFFASAVDTLQTLVIALGAGLGVWGVVNLLEGYGSDNPGAKSQGMKQMEDSLLYAASSSGFSPRTSAMVIPPQNAFSRSSTVSSSQGFTLSAGAPCFTQSAK